MYALKKQKQKQKSGVQHVKEEWNPDFLTGDCQSTDVLSLSMKKLSSLLLCSWSLYWFPVSYSLQKWFFADKHVSQKGHLILVPEA